MKRAFPQKVKPVFCHPSASAKDAEVGQPRQPLSGVNRKARTSAAMIGLALSMGAASLLIPRQSDGATAAESMATESTSEVVPLAHQLGGLPVQAAVEISALGDTPASSTVSYAVREGETLWRIARIHRVSVRAIAAANGIADDAVIRVGQTLRIPASASPRREASTVAPVSSPLDSHSVSLTESNIDSGDVVKAERDNALQRLRQERDKLRNSLTDLRSGSSPYSTATPPKARSIASASQTNRPLENSPASPESADAQSPEAVVTSDPTAATHGLTHQVKPGETLGAIASSYGVSQRDLASLNRLTSPNRLGVDQEILIPTSASSQGVGSIPQSTGSNPEATAPSAPVPTASQSESADTTSSVVYRVSPGDTLGEIAQTYSIPETSLTHVNQLGNPNLILVGQVLQIPSDSPTSAIDDSPIAAATIPANSVTEQFRPEGFSSTWANDGQAYVPASVDVPTVPGVEAEHQDGQSAEPAIAQLPPSEDGAMASVELDASAQSLQSSQQVAATPLIEDPSAEAAKSSHEAVSTGSNPYVAQLMSEILAMRDRYRATGSTSSSQHQHTVVAATPEALPSPLNSSDVNPEFSSASYLATANTQPSGSQIRPEERDTPSQNVSDQNVSEASPSQATQPPRLLATAPLGSENYEPLLQPVAGQLVSPDLPPLQGAEAFLPNASPSLDGFIWPARGVLSSGYGWRWGRMHRGIDIAAPIGTPVHAAASGTIESSGWNSGYGNMINVRHADGTVTRYAHLSRSLVRAGQHVEQGEQIGLVGSTGYSTGPHLHFEVHLPNQGTVNPIAYLPGR